MKDEKLFLLALSQGTGFTAACELVNENPKEVSKELAKNDNQKEYAINALRSFKIALLKAAKAAQDAGKQKEADQYSQRAVNGPSLVLWGDSLVTIDKVNPKAVADTFLRIQDPKDTATSLGMTFQEYVAYLGEYPQILNYVRGIMPEAQIV